MIEFGNDYSSGEAVDRETSQVILEGAFERGINFIDTANIYGIALATTRDPSPDVARATSANGCRG